MKIICIGRNYTAHAAELNNPMPEEPVFFLKPETALIRPGMPFFIPGFSSDIHYEAELVYRICKLGRHIQPRYAHLYYQEVGVGIDFTARDLQQKLKQKGLPWEASKAFDGSAPHSQFVKLSELAYRDDISFSLQKNGETVQRGSSSQMHFSIDQIISYVSRFITLKMGDLIFSGTPAGVGPVKAGDELEAFLEDNSMLRLKIK